MIPPKERNIQIILIQQNAHLQYWTYLYCSPSNEHYSNFAIALVVALNLFISFFAKDFVSLLLFFIALRNNAASIVVALML